MKKFIMGLVAVIVAMTTCFAFTKPHEKKLVAPYYFAVQNDPAAGNYGSAVLIFPAVGDKPTNASPRTDCDDTDQKMCVLGFPGYVLDGNNQWRPGTTTDGTSVEITDYSLRTGEHTKGN